jgi:predicted RecB family endonuclease
MVYVVKATGEKEVFSPEKLRASIRRAGIPKELEEAVVSHITERLYENIPTQEIYRHIREFLQKSPFPYSTTRYSLKQAIMDFGPTGYPFEDFAGEILKAMGYIIKLRQIISGRCITHEIDIIAQKNGKKVMVECKFHNSSGSKTDVQVALYTKARFDDVREKNGFDSSLLITNTKVTEEALSYAECVGMEVVSWSFPEGKSLRELIEKFRFHPITALQTLSQDQKQTLLNNHISLCKTICENKDILDILHISDEKKKEVLSEVNFVCSM